MAMRTGQSPLFALPIAGVLAILQGCSSETGMFRSAGGPKQTLLVFVRDRDTMRPIQGAAVAVETASRDHPFSAASILGQTGPDDSRATTNEHGEVRLTWLEGREFRVVIWTPGRSPAVLGPVTLNGASGAWLDPALPPGTADPGVQARIHTPSKPSGR